jgi:hypothetical protein
MTGDTLNHGIRILGTGDWCLTVNHGGDAWSFDTQQVVSLSGSIPPTGYQGFYNATCYRSLDGKKLAFSGGNAWIGFVTNGELLDVNATLLSDKGSILIISVADYLTTEHSSQRFMLALTPLGVHSLGRAASPPEEIQAIDLPPEVVESLRTFAHQLAE